MTIRDVLKLGCIELITKCDKVVFPLNIETIKEINDMKDTLLSIQNSYCIAANQIGIKKQIIIYKNNNNKYEVLINPQIDSYSSSIKEDWESSISTPGIYAVVPRYTDINISYLDECCVLHDEMFTSLKSRFIQNGIDSLKGISILHSNKNKDLIVFK